MGQAWRYLWIAPQTSLNQKTGPSLMNLQFQNHEMPGVRWPYLGLPKQGRPASE